VAEVAFLDAALDDLRRLGPDAAVKVLRKILVLVEEPRAGQPLGGELTGFRKLVVGRNTWRVVYRVVGDAVVVCEIWAVGRRADGEVYAEATARAREAAAGRPEISALPDVVAALGRRVEPPPVPPRREPVPDWLARRLIHTAGFRPEQVVGLDAQQALDAWTEHIRKTR
jgi:mRNA interferase RelE/StbE